MLQIQSSINLKTFKINQKFKLPSDKSLNYYYKRSFLPQILYKRKYYYRKKYYCLKQIIFEKKKSFLLICHLNNFNNLTLNLIKLFWQTLFPNESCLKIKFLKNSKLFNFKNKNFKNNNLFKTNTILLKFSDNLNLINFLNEGFKVGLIPNLFYPLSIISNFRNKLIPINYFNEFNSKILKNNFLKLDYLNILFKLNKIFFNF